MACKRSHCSLGFYSEIKLLIREKSNLILKAIPLTAACTQMLYKIPS